jgi:hypothetical protein
MALTIIEQLNILTGVVPTPSYDLTTYVEQVTINAATDFLSGAKTIDASLNPQAQIYLARMRDLCRELQIRPERYTTQLAKVLIGIYADTGDYTTVQAATEDQWITFIEGNIVAAAESVAGVLAQEKTDYISV